MERDVFICYASEDKESIAKPLFDALSSEKINCWFDENEIHWGDDISQKINEGLKASRFGIVIFSKFLHYVNVKY